MKDFAGRKLIVVGGTSGMGRMVAQFVLKRGGSAVVVGRRDDRVAATVDELGHLGLVAGERADLTRMSDVDALRSRIDSKHTDADHLVNAAGIFVPKAFLDHTVEDYDRYLSINRSLFFVTQTVGADIGRAMLHAAGDSLDDSSEAV
jgi:NAD(P)-dependent dehydrogenase (short-subunit alcohol dehydrogenase family)